MKTENELNKDILMITMAIEEKCPELSKYIGEMTVETGDTSSPGGIIKNLMDYYDSLDTLLKRYTIHHGNVKNYIPMHNIIA
jgi:hypothetical protein